MNTERTLKKIYSSLRESPLDSLFLWTSVTSFFLGASPGAFLMVEQWDGPATSFLLLGSALVGFYCAMFVAAALKKVDQEKLSPLPYVLAVTLFGYLGWISTMGA